MNKVFLGLLLISSVLLTGCENTSGAIQENVQATDFSQKKNTSEDLKSEKGFDINLSKNDLLYDFVNSGIIGEPDNLLSDEDQSPDLVTNVSSSEESSSINTDPNTSSNAFGDFFDSSTSIPADFDSFFSSSGQSSLEVGDFSFANSDFKIDSERQEKIKTRSVSQSVRKNIKLSISQKGSNFFDDLFVVVVVK